MNKDFIKIILLRTLPIMTGYVVLGFGFGILLHQAGYGVGWAFLMSLIVYSGTMQYVGIGLLSGGASIITTIAMSIAINARYMFYGISMIEKYRGSGRKKPYLIFATTDETYALLCASSVPAGVSKEKYYFTVALLNQLYWIFGCSMGALLGSSINIEVKGLEFTLTALIISIFVDQWKGTEKHFPAIVGLIITSACLFVFGKESFLIPALLLILFGLTIGRRWIDEH